VEQGEPVLGGDRGLDQRDEVAQGDERAIQSAAPGARAASTVWKPPIRTAAADVAPRCARNNASAFHEALRDP
jgi:hypothetical protein